MSATVQCSFTKPVAYIAHDAAQTLRDITEGRLSDCVQPLLQPSKSYSLIELNHTTGALPNPQTHGRYHAHLSSTLSLTHSAAHSVTSIMFFLFITLLYFPCFFFLLFFVFFLINTTVSYCYIRYIRSLIIMHLFIFV